MTAEEFRRAQGRRTRSTKPTRPVRKVSVELPYRLTLPFLPPSINKLFSTIVDRETGVTKRVLTTNARKVRKLIFAMIRGQVDADGLFELQVDVFLKAYTKKGKVRKVDLTNRVKFLEDCVCEALGVDDSHIFRVILNKHDSETEQTIVTLRRWEGAE